MEFNGMKEFAEYLLGMGAKYSEPTFHEVGGEVYAVHGAKMERIPKRDEKPAPNVFNVYTLSGLIEWIKEDVNGFFKDPAERCIVNVTGPTNVRVITPNKGVENLSQTLAHCVYDAPNIRFNQYMDSESFGVMIQTAFVDDPNRDVVLRIVHNLAEEYSEATADDGISQRVNIKRGVQEVDSMVFRNPAYLRPLRTFTEVRQPDSPFVLRFKEGKQAALFEADGGAWRVHAVQTVGEYLKEQLKGCNVVVIA